MENGFIIIIIGIVLLIIILSQIFSKKAVIKRKLRKTPSKKISEFKDGDVAKLTGKAECINTPLIAPLSGRECTYYYVLVEKQTSSGKSTHWKTIIEEEVSNDFIIKQGDNKAVINTENVKSYLVIDESFSSGFLDDATPNLEQYLNKHDHESTGLFGMNKTLRYKEGIIEIGEEVAVVGAGNWQVNENEKILEITAFGENSVFLSDHPDTLAFVEVKKNKAIKMHISKKHSNQKRNNKKLPRYNKSYK